MKIVAIGGGDKEPSFGIATALKSELPKGLTVSGTSAGALWPFAKIHSCPAKKPEEEIWDYIQLDGLGLLQAAATAHANQHDKTPAGRRPHSRLDHLTLNFPEGVEFGFGIDNGAALIVRDTEALVMTSVPDANVHILERRSAYQVAVTPVDDAAHLTQALRELANSPLHMLPAAD